jgi:hypothetical protein
MAGLREQIDQARQAFSRLSQQEQFMALGIGGAVALLSLIGLGFWVSGAIDATEHRVKVKTDQLTEVAQLQSDYRARKTERERKMRELAGDVRLVSLVEGVAKQAGVEISQLSPDDGEPNEDGIVKSRVGLRASNLSADRLQDFLSRLENARGLVIVERLKITRPYRHDTVNLELTVTTFKKSKS